MKILLIACSIFVLSGFAIAQAPKRTITNLDLEKYKTQRLAAEKDLKENYEALGFPSPEEMAARQKAAEIESNALSERLVRERVERERLWLEQQYVQSLGGPSVYVVQNSNDSQSRPFYYTGYYRRYPNHFPQYPPGYYLPNGTTVGGGYFYPNANPNQGVRINTTPIQINTTGPNNPPVRIRAPR
jgi:hypothetical protein